MLRAVRVPRGRGVCGGGSAPEAAQHFASEEVFDVEVAAARPLAERRRGVGARQGRHAWRLTRRGGARGVGVNTPPARADRARARQGWVVTHRFADRVARDAPRRCGRHSAARARWSTSWRAPTRWREASMLHRAPALGRAHRQQLPALTVLRKLIGYGVASCESTLAGDAQFRSALRRKTSRRRSLARQRARASDINALGRSELSRGVPLAGRTRVVVRDGGSR